MENFRIEIFGAEFVTKCLFISLETAFGKTAVVKRAIFDVDNLLLKKAFVISYELFFPIQ